MTRQEAREAAAEFAFYISRGTNSVQDTLAGKFDGDPIVQAFAAAILAAEQRGRREGIEAAAKVPEKRAEERFAEYGTREPDTNATYYSGQRGETLEELDEEDEAIASAIRALPDKEPT